MHVHTNLTDREFSITYSIAIALWLIAAGLVVLNWFVEPELGDPGILVAVLAGVVTVRGYLVRMHCREQRAFDLGRELEAAKRSGVSQLH